MQINTSDIIVTLLTDCTVSSKSVKYLSESLKWNTSLTFLNLHRTPKELKIFKINISEHDVPAEACIGPEGALYISEALKVNSTLTRLYLSCT